MDNPELFVKQQSIRSGVRKTVEEYFYLLDYNKNENSTVLDIGCGPGNITHDILLPLFKNPVSKIVGTDISKTMVDFANATYGDSIFSFELFDIGKEAPKIYISYFDYVFSFWTLHWIRDQRKLFTNINKIMKPNGQMLLYYVAKSELFDIYKKIWVKHEYAPYITDFNASQSCFQESKDPTKDLQTILEECGFEISVLKTELVNSKRTTAPIYKEFLTSINPSYEKIPDHLKDKFMEDHLQEVRNMRGHEFIDNNYYVVSYNFLVYAKKK